MARQLTYFQETVDIPANSSLTVNLLGQAFSILDIAGDITIKIDNQDESDIDAGIGFALDETDNAQKLRFFDKSGTGSSVTYAYGRGSIRDDRKTILGTIVTQGGSTRDHGATSVSTSAKKIIDANADRTGWIIKNNGSETIYVGSTSSLTTNNGFPVEPDGALSGDDTDNVYAIADSGSQNIRFYEVSET